MTGSSALDRPCLLVFTAPSGAGKTTIVRHLLQHFAQLAFSVSATTRQRRDGEEEGRDYYFLSALQFQQKIAEGAFAEWEEVYDGQFYGTLHSEIERLHGLGKCIVFDIDVQGALRLKRKFGEQCLTVFVQPPSLEILIHRLRSRNTESPASLERRIGKATEELSYAGRFDHILHNDVLIDALKEAENLVHGFLKR